MKLRYYLRGLGIGMLVAALVLILSGNTGGKMSDEAVKRRAAELGMVEKDKTVLDDLEKEKNDQENKETDAPPVNEENEALSGNDEAGQAAGPDAAKEEVQDFGEEGNGTAPVTPADKTPVQNGEQELAREIEERAEEVADRGKEVAENSVPEKTVTFQVRQGDSSISVARRAEEMGLVKSAADFDVFLCQNGYDKRISIGSYEIAEGASEKEIADKITKTN